MKHKANIILRKIKNYKIEKADILPLTLSILVLCAILSAIFDNDDGYLRCIYHIIGTTEGCF